MKGIAVCITKNARFFAFTSIHDQKFLWKAEVKSIVEQAVFMYNMENWTNPKSSDVTTLSEGVDWRGRIRGWH